MFSWLLMLGCTTATEDDGLVGWSGWVYTDGQTSDTNRLAEGNVTFWLDPYEADGEVAAEEPYPDFLGYWSVRVPAATPVDVRITSPTTRPTVWTGDTPQVDGIWFSGALFGVTDRWIEDTFDALMGNGDEWVAVVQNEEVLVLGAPANNQIGCEELLVGLHSPSCWLVGEDGSAAPVTEGPVTWFAAAAEPGVVTVTIGAAEEHWRADAGDVVMAWYLSEGGT